MKHIEQELALEHRNLKPQEITMSRIAEVAEVAWNATKPKDDPLFADCILDHKQKLITHAEAVERTGVPIENPSDFEKKVKELLGDPVSTANAISKAKVDAANAAAETAQEQAKAVAASAKAEVAAVKADAKAGDKK